jgi:outer membrane protein OmpA-like peptidoglycan-associated protein
MSPRACSHSADGHAGSGPRCRALALGLLALGLVACAAKPPAPPPPSERIILLPGADGKVGELVVTAGNEVRLREAYGAALVDANGVRFAQASPAEVAERYGGALAAMPPGANSYVLYFDFDKATLLPGAQATFSRLLDDFKQRPAAEVIIIGHTDKAGNAKYNEELSQRRARTVRALLVDKGVSAAMIEMAWRGDREPLPETAGKVSDPRNRRVEVKVR